MKIPDASKAIIPVEKLRDYLVSTSHPVGGAKAKFFGAQGFDESNIELLERALLAMVTNEEVSAAELSPHGTKYVVEGPLDLPGGGSVKVRTVWITEREGDPPRFVTGLPGINESGDPP